MKKFFLLVFFCSGLFFIGTTSSSCSPKTGCPINENAHVKPNKKGKYKRTKTRSGLFPKDMKRGR